MEVNIPNLMLRHFAGESDYAKIAEVINACADVDPTALADTSETVANRYENLVNCDLHQDMIIADVDGEMVGFSRTDWRDEVEMGRDYGFGLLVKPAWRGKGIAGQMMQWMEQHLQAKAIQHGKVGSAFLSSRQTNRDQENTRLLERAGYQPYRQFIGYIRSLGDDLPIVQLPEGIELRPVTQDDYRTIWQISDELLQELPGYPPLTDEMYQSWINNIDFQPNLWPVAWDPATDQIAGFALSFEEKGENVRFNRRRATIYEVEVRRPWRKRGLARALILQTLHTLRVIGVTEATIGIEATTHDWAKPLLEQNGFVEAWRSTDYRKAL